MGKAKEKQVLTVVREHYKKKEEKMPNTLKYIITGLNLADKGFKTFTNDFELDPDDEDEVIRFIANPDNSVLLGKYGYGQLKIWNRRMVIDGTVIDEGNYMLKLK
ncbi:hypothetical protein EOM09_05940 [bacterium]|nr:hypothetical protein [bacterium]